MALKLHHIGVLVADLESGRALAEAFLGARVASEPIEDPLQEATVQFCEAEGGLIELIAPLGESSHLHNVLKRSGEGLLHLCYETADLDAELERYQAAGARLISRKPAIAFEQRDVAFVFLPNRMIVELLAR